MRIRNQANDEIGELTEWLNTFVGKLQELITEIAVKTKDLDYASTNLSDEIASLVGRLKV